MNLLGAFALSLGLTLGLEALIAAVFRMRGRDWLLFALVNVLTNPAVVYLDLVFCLCFPNGCVFAWQIPLELAVVAAEGALYSRLSALRRPWLFAVLANVFSYGMGRIIF